MAPRLAMSILRIAPDWDDVCCSGWVILTPAMLRGPPPYQFFAALGKASQASGAGIGGELVGVFRALDHSEQKATLSFAKCDLMHGRALVA